MANAGQLSSAEARRQGNGIRHRFGLFCVLDRVAGLDFAEVWREDLNERTVRAEFGRGECGRAEEFPRNGAWRGS